METVWGETEAARPRLVFEFEPPRSEIQKQSNLDAGGRKDLSEKWEGCCFPGQAGLALLFPGHGPL